MIEFDRIVRGVSIRKTQGIIPASIGGVTGDSRDVKPGDLFIALRGGTSDGHQFLGQALEKGAAAAVVDHPRPSPIPQIVVDDTLACLPRIAANFYNHPAQNLVVYGITGTKGKTTTAYLIESILNAEGLAAAVIGTIEYRYGGKRIDASNTTPLPHEMQRMLREIVDCGVRHLVMEVSSHGLALHRVDEIRFSVGLFTNLTLDHLDFHKTMDDYRETKKLLFTRYLMDEGACVLNLDEETGRRFARELEGRRIVTYAIDRDADFRARDIDTQLTGNTFTLETRQGDRIPIHTHLVGRHNVYNIMGAIAAARSGGVSLEAIRRGVESMRSVPGRLESVPNGIGAQVVVDYCHTPDALEKCLHTLNAIPHKRIITLFGCGGDRDRSKRPIMGEIALRFSDYTIVTSDNPRTENPQSIIDEILSGMTESQGRYAVISDRREAIRKGVEELQSGDIFLLAGKGHETYQILGRQKYPFDDRLIAREYLNEMGKGVGE